MQDVNPWIQVLGVLGIGGIGAAIVAAFSARKKVGSETNQNIVATTGDLIDIANGEVDRARAELKESRKDREVWESERRRWWFRADVHSEWDRARLREALDRGETLPAPPPLYPDPTE